MAIGFPVKDDYVTGDVLTAANMNDLSGSVNLLQSTQYAAGKNRVINGGFAVAQRGTSFSNPSSGAYNLDRFLVTYNGSTTPTQTISQQALNGAISGLDQPNYLRIAITTIGSGQTNEYLAQRIEDVRTVGGEVTLSFYAKADTTRTFSDVGIGQVFGSGGSTRVDTSFSNIVVTTTWTRYSVTATLPSVSGKTIGAGSYLELYFNVGAANGLTVDIAGLQLEEGSTASPFQTATGTIQGELAACQRYYNRYTAGPYTTAGYYNTTQLYPTITFPVEMRIAPTAIGTSAAGALVSYVNGSSRTSTALAFNSSTTKTLNITMTTSSATAGQAGGVDVVSTQFVEMSAEL
jgi:hypothetical protein